MKITPEFFVDDKNDKCVRFIVNGTYLFSRTDNKVPLVHRVSKDADGYEYYNVPNIYSYRTLLGEKGGTILYKFRKMPKDMLTTIQENDGDVITRGMFGMEHVARYLNREYGESLRQQTLEGWKDAKFGWGLYISSGGFEDSLVSSKLEISTFFNAKKVFSCSSKEEAQRMRDYLVDRCKNILIRDYENFLLKLKKLGIKDENDTLDSLWKTYMDDSRLSCHVLTAMFALYASPLDYTPEELKYRDRFNDGRCLSICQVVLN